VREITIIRSTSPSGKTKLKLPPIDFTEGDSEGNKTDKVVKKYLTIHVLKEGDFFGVGEDLKKTYIISVGRVSMETGYLVTKSFRYKSFLYDLKH